MNIVEIASDSDASSVFAELQALGRAWRPREDVPWLVYLDAGSLEEIGEIPGVRACWKGRCGAVARLLHGQRGAGAAEYRTDVAAPGVGLRPAAGRGIDLASMAVRGHA